MKELHEELTAAFQKCQNELELTRKSLEHTNWQLQQVTSGEAQQEIVREYVEEISQLKHLIIRLEDEINQYERKGLSRQYRSVHLPNCDELSSSRVFSDKRGIIANEAEEKDKDKHKKGRKQEKSKEQKKNSKRELQSSEKEGKRGNKTSHRVTASAKPHLSKQVRSKTLMDKQSPEFKSAGRMQEEVEEQKVRIANFCSRFLTMVECFSAQAVRCQQSNQALTRRMKVAWKWVKGVVAEWHRLDKLAKESGLSRPAR